MNLAQSQSNYPLDISRTSSNQQTSKQPFQQPLPNALSLSLSLSRPLPLDSIQTLHQLKLNPSKKQSGFDFLRDPTKRIRHAQQAFTESFAHIREVPQVPFQKRGITQNGLHNPQRHEYPGMDYLNQNLRIPIPKPMVSPNEEFASSSKLIDLMKCQQLEQQIKQQQLARQYQIRQQLMRQIGYQHNPHAYQQQHQQQQPLNSLLQRQLALQLQKQNYQRVNLMQENARLMMNGQDNVQYQHNLLMRENEISPQQYAKMEAYFSPSQVKIDPKCEDTDYKVEEGLIKLEELERTTLSNSCENYDEKMFEKLQIEAKIKKAFAKDGNFPGQQKENLVPKDLTHQQKSEKLEKSGKFDRSESRRKNKWQVLAEQKAVQDAVSQANASGNGGMQFNEPENDDNIDFEYLQSITITNDPAKLGYSLPADEFAVIAKDTGKITEESEPKQTGVGSRYQAVIPELRNTRIAPKRKEPKSVWNPKAIEEKELKEYFQELSKILKCNVIYQERALKLLKRKNYQREKVRVNISKNEKFYSSFLVVSDAPKPIVGEPI